jgi:quercetin dioxygenase-like cupin family protein
MTVEDQVYEIEAPTVIKIPPDVKHGLKVIGTETLLKLNAHSPPREKALRIEFMNQE